MPADPTQPVPGPTREQIAEVIVANIGRDCDDVNAAADAVLALLPARPSPTDDDLALHERAMQVADDLDVTPWTTYVVTCNAREVIDLLLAEIERLRARPCPWVRGETTQWCALAAGTEPTEEPT